MSKLKLNLDAVQVESYAMMGEKVVVLDAAIPKTQPVSDPCCYTVYMA